MSNPTCTCMTEDPGDGYGERVITHSRSCPEHPDYVTTPVHLAPCGDEFDTEQDAIDHAALCGPCAGAVEARLLSTTGPVRRTKTHRRHAAQDARAALQTYLDNLGDSSDAMQVRRLGWALAHIERALYAETNRRAGRAHSHSKDALSRQSNIVTTRSQS